eukprot:CAMPEP_0182565520 /NCGR_PEP_ID=MMETSP1324-20130603/7214_1 /TAXON_ID=236786 /ORGANISM="Florenciella sp., Strain RCC1587" /LENGTH=65 /DNA_ID=CAMNT_0024779189 /DNA_START=1368 /DNA_END=1561 /DNA_ORIENTATION=-
MSLLGCTCTCTCVCSGLDRAAETTVVPLVLTAISMAAHRTPHKPTIMAANTSPSTASWTSVPTST